MANNPPVETNIASEGDEIFERQLAFAQRISNEVIEATGIPQGPATDKFPAGRRWRLFYANVNGNIVVSIELRPQGVGVLVHAGLTFTVLRMLQDLELLLDDGAARELFKITNDEELENSLFNRMMGLSISYISHLPTVLYHAFTLATTEAIIGDIKKVVEPIYKYEDEEADARNLDLLPNNELGDILRRFPNVDLQLLKELDSADREFVDYRKAARSGRKVWLTPEIFENLGQMFEEFRIGYAAVKKDYLKLRDAYALVHKNKSLDGWGDHWAEYVETTHREYIFSPNDIERTPSELAYRHLGRLYDYNEKTIERKVVESRAAARARNLNTQIPDRPIKPKNPLLAREK